MDFSRRRTRFLWGSLFEFGVLVAAAILSVLTHFPLLRECRWDAFDFGIGGLAAIPPFGLFVWMLRHGNRSLKATRVFLEQSIRPFFEDWSVWQLAIISILAGLGEELLFRSFVQTKLSEVFGVPAGLAIASLLFGCVHWINLEYVLLTTLMGAYLGGLFVVTDNLLVPIATHALYDFAALVYFLRIHRVQV